MQKFDLNKEKGTLNESISRSIASWTKTLLKYMYGKDAHLVVNLNEEDEEVNTTRFVIKGEFKDVKSYAKAVVAMKEFLDAYLEFGDPHPQTAKKRTELRTHVANFENTTGLTWPFKDED